MVMVFATLSHSITPAKKADMKRGVGTKAMFGERPIVRPSAVGQSTCDNKSTLVYTELPLKRKIWAQQISKGDWAAWTDAEFRKKRCAEAEPELSNCSLMP